MFNTTKDAKEVIFINDSCVETPFVVLNLITSVPSSALEARRLVHVSSLTPCLPRPIVWSDRSTSTSTAGSSKCHTHRPVSVRCSVMIAEGPLKTTRLLTVTGSLYTPIYLNRSSNLKCSTATFAITTMHIRKSYICGGTAFQVRDLECR